jgi:hypothetical protein
MKWFIAVSQNSETSKTSSYLAKLFACFASASKKLLPQCITKRFVKQQNTEPLAKY